MSIRCQAAPAEAGAEQAMGRDSHISPQAREQELQGSTIPIRLLGQVWVAGAEVKG